MDRQVEFLEGDFDALATVWGAKLNTQLLRLQNRIHGR
jgi:hypothetical protein